MDGHKVSPLNLVFGNIHCKLENIYRQGWIQNPGKLNYQSSQTGPVPIYRWAYDRWARI